MKSVILHITQQTNLIITNMRTITKIILHCTATPRGREVSIDEIRQWHLARGFADVGYHYVVHLDGSVSRCRPETQVGAHCAGHNADSIGVAYVGGLQTDGKTPADTRTPAQRVALRNLIRDIQTAHPGAQPFTHHEFCPTKACPCFKIEDL